MNGSDPKATFPGTPGSRSAAGGAVGNQSGSTGSNRPPGQGTHDQGPPQTAYVRVPDTAPGGGGNLHQGVLLGKYQIVRQLGSGGMGAVYEAIHTSIGKSVALKTMNPALASDPRAEARFMREAAAASRLGHPNVCDVTDFGSDQGVVYIVMELMRGEDLAGLVAHAPAGLDASFVADVMLAVCAGVYAAHEKGVVHRDLKPQNIFLSRTPLGDVVPKVLDFGISKLLDEEVAGSLTNSGSVMGTTHYLSPEQVTGNPVDGRSDEFALGVILYECLTGQRPHAGDTIFTIMRAISEGRFQRPRALRPDLLPALEAVILRAMALRPDDRYPTTHALGNGLLPFASPKGRVMWVDYFSRPPVAGLSAAMQGSGFQGMTGQQQQPQPQHYSGNMSPTMLMGGPRPFSGDTRSGVGPVSVQGTGELAEQGRRGRTRGLAFALAGAALATAGLVFFRPAFFSGPSASKVSPPPQLEQLQDVNKPAAPPTAQVPTPAQIQQQQTVTPTAAPPAQAPASAAAQQPIGVAGDGTATAPLTKQGAAKERALAAARAKAATKAAAQAARDAAAAQAPPRKASPAPPAVTRTPVPVRPRPAPPRTPTEKPVPDDDLIDGPRSIITPGRAPILD